jgi:hypothetical protein
MLSAWETVWACVGISVLVLVLDGWLANRAGPSKEELTRKALRGERMSQLNKGKESE